MFPDLPGSDQWTTSIYLKHNLQPSRKVRTLGSSDLDQLHVPRVRTSVGTRAFSVVAPRLGNELPSEIPPAKTQISFLVRLFFRLKSSVVRMAQTTNANGFRTMSRITIMFVAPLSCHHRGFRIYRRYIMSGKLDHFKGLLFNWGGGGLKRH